MFKYKIISITYNWRDNIIWTIVIVIPKYTYPIGKVDTNKNPCTWTVKQKLSC
jgi:hypothetical protein